MILQYVDVNFVLLPYNSLNFKNRDTLSLYPIMHIQLVLLPSIQYYNNAFMHDETI